MNVSMMELKALMNEIMIFWGMKKKRREILNTYLRIIL